MVMNDLNNIHIDYSGQRLTSLEGVPEEVSNSFYCDINELTTLEYAPRKIGNIFDCHDNPLKTIKHLKDTKGITTLFLSESKHMKVNDYIREIIKYKIKLESIVIYSVNTESMLVDKNYKEIIKDYLNEKYNIKDF